MEKDRRFGVKNNSLPTEYTGQNKVLGNYLDAFPLAAVTIFPSSGKS
jgi:hypothetical protein